MMENKKIVNDKSQLFVKKESEPKYIRVSQDSDEYLKVWVKEPTWLQVETALSSVLNIDSKSQNFDLDLNKMYRYHENIIKNFPSFIKKRSRLYYKPPSSRSKK